MVGAGIAAVTLLGLMGITMGVMVGPDKLRFFLLCVAFGALESLRQQPHDADPADETDDRTSQSQRPCRDEKVKHLAEWMSGQLVSDVRELHAYEVANDVCSARARIDTAVVITAARHTRRSARSTYT